MSNSPDTILQLRQYFVTSWEPEDLYIGHGRFWIVVSQRPDGNFHMRQVRGSADEAAAAFAAMRLAGQQAFLITPKDIATGRWWCDVKFEFEHSNGKAYILYETVGKSDAVAGPGPADDAVGEG